MSPDSTSFPFIPLTNRGQPLNSKEKGQREKVKGRLPDQEEGCQGIPAFAGMTEGAGMTAAVLRDSRLTRE